LNETAVEKDLCQVALIAANKDGKDGKTVSLTPLRVFAYEMTLLLKDNNGTLLLSNLESLYFEKFGSPLRPAQQGYPTVLSMLQAISDIASVQGKQRTKRIVVLNSAKPVMESTSDDSSSTYERQTPRSGHGSHWKTKENRCQNSGSPFRPGSLMMGIMHEDGGQSCRHRYFPLLRRLVSHLGTPKYLHLTVLRH